MKLFKKKKGHKDSQYVINDITIAYECLIRQKRFPTNKNSVLAITVTDTNSKHEKDLNHTLTNRVFNKIKNDSKGTEEHINYLFVIEYPKIVTQGKYLPNKCDIHAHVVINTSHNVLDIEKYFKRAFSELDLYIIDITNRDDIEYYGQYLIKQGKSNSILSDSSYNYKIAINGSDGVT